MVMITVAYVIRWSSLAAHASNASCMIWAFNIELELTMLQYGRGPPNHRYTAATLAVTFSGSGIENRKA